MDGRLHRARRHRALNTFRLHSFLSTEGDRWREPADWLAAINRFLHGALPRGQFATMLCAVIDFDERSLKVASAAAPLPIVVGRGGGARLLDVGGLPLGIDPRAACDTLQTPFGPGSMLLAFSDALIETPSPDAPCLTLPALAALAARHVAEGPASLVGAILTNLSAAAHGLGDDLTITALLHTEYAP